MTKRVAILTNDYFEQSELEEPLKALRTAKISVDIISAGDKQLQALQHVDMGAEFEADVLLDEADPADYDALVLPGGAINADKLRMVDKARAWVLEFLDSDRPLAVICHAPWVLISADAIEDRRVTSYFTIQDDIRNAGAEWINQAVVVDDNLITCRGPDDLPQFNRALLAQLIKKPNS